LVVGVVALSSALATSVNEGDYPGPTNTFMSVPLPADAGTMDIAINLMPRCRDYERPEVVLRPVFMTFGFHSDTVVFTKIVVTHFVDLSTSDPIPFRLFGADVNATGEVFNLGGRSYPCDPVPTIQYEGMVRLANGLTWESIPSFPQVNAQDYFTVSLTPVEAGPK
jgi:hypothetical protein